VNGAPAALAASLLWGTADFLAGRASRRHPTVLVALVGQTAGFVVLAAILAFHGADAGALPGGLFAGAVGVGAVLAFYGALGRGTMSVVAPIGATSALVPLAYGIVQGDRPGALQWVGVAAALAGAVLASREPDKTEVGVPAGPAGPAGARHPVTREDQRTAVRLAVLAAFLIGLTLVGLDKAAEHDALTGVWAARLVAVPALALVALRARATAPVAALPGLAVIGLLDTAANSAFAIATTTGLLSLVAVLGGLFPVVTVALAYLVLHERLEPLQRAGVVLALAGVPLISA
jgi:drug/metabolite transporter (DMT)-like permease